MNLSVSNLFLELAFILLPGFIWAKIHKAYGPKVEMSQFDLVLNSFIYSIVSYLILAAIFWALGIQLRIISLSADAKQLLQPEILPEVIYALIIALVSSILWLYVVNYKLMTQVVQAIKATKTYGDEDVWDFAFNSSSPAVRFVHVRDFEQQVVYAGDVRAFSETEKLRELMLANVTVYDFDGKRLYDVPAIYLSRAPEGVHLEFPNR